MTTMVLFDADGVIQSPSPAWRRSLEALAPDGPEALIADIFAAEKTCLTGQQSFAGVLAPVLAAHRIEVPLDEVLELWALIDPHDDNLRVVDDVRASGVRAGLATNQQSYRAACLRDRLGYGERFDHLFLSCELGVAKPDPDYFARIAAILETSPRDLVFIDDHPANVEAAASVGLRAGVYSLATGADGLRTLLAQLGVGVSEP